jgi:hypothetical protein
MNDMEPIAHFAEDGRTHGLEEHLRGDGEAGGAIRGGVRVRGVGEAGWVV